MNFQNIHPVEDYQFYLDLSFRRAKEKGKEFRSHKLKGGRIEKSKYMELVKMQVISDTIAARMDAIVKSFPSFDELPDFYKELVKLQIDYVQLKRSLGAVNWLGKKSLEFMQIYRSKLEKNSQFDRINILKKEFLGRISSMVKQIRHDLAFLEQVRKIMKNFPEIKTSLKTVAVVGFPNVGKTTLLFKLTGSKAEINSYPFTTKAINISYIGSGKDAIQVMDTPGTLNRIDKMNNIERVSYLALDYCTDIIIYVFDLTEEYPLKSQELLYNRLNQDFKKEIIVYLSKSDIIDNNLISEFKKRYNGITDISELKTILQQKLLQIEKK